jgi:hypothetical protein
VYRTIIENFNKGRINPFWTPVVYDNVNAYVTIDATEFLTLYSNASVGDSAFLRSVLPVCGNYSLFFKFRVQACADSSAFFVLYEEQTVPKPTTLATVFAEEKFRCWWDAPGVDIEIAYYNTSNVYTGLDLNNPAALGTWYWIYLEKNSTNYKIIVFNEDFTTLTGPSTVARSSVYQGNNPDYLVFGNMVNDDAAIDLDIDKIILLLDPNANKVSNSIQFANSNILGRGLG